MKPWKDSSPALRDGHVGNDSSVIAPGDGRIREPALQTGHEHVRPSIEEKFRWQRSIVENPEGLPAS